MFIIVAAVVHHHQRSSCVYVCLVDAWFESVGPMTNAGQEKKQQGYSAGVVALYNPKEKKQLRLFGLGNEGF